MFPVYLRKNSIPIDGLKEWIGRFNRIWKRQPLDQREYDLQVKLTETVIVRAHRRKTSEYVTGDTGAHSGQFVL